jgi:hypothetical protein
MLWLGNGEREALITNLGEEEVAEGSFPEKKRLTTGYYRYYFLGNIAYMLFRY